MFSTDTLYIGIDPTAGEKEFGFVALDGNLNLVKFGDSDLDELILFLEGPESVYIGINAPAGVNRGLVKKKLEEDNLKSNIRKIDIRMAEFELREHGIAIAGTPSHEDYCPAWMQLGFALYRKLADIGFNPYNQDGTNRHVLETHPFACFCVLAESAPFPKPTLEGRLQRQSILFDKGLRINDAMSFFEEITRFKLIKGILPMDVLHTPEQLDMMVAAYTAWLGVNRPEEVTNIGDKTEGKISLPISELRGKY
jgi:hypothetical protein